MGGVFFGFDKGLEPFGMQHAGGMLL